MKLRKVKRVTAFILSALMMLINMTNITYAEENVVYEAGVGRLTGIVETAYDPGSDMSVADPDIAELVHGIDKKDGKWKVMVKGIKIGETTASIKLVGETSAKTYSIKVVDGSIKDGVQRISANNLAWTPVSGKNPLGGADDFSALFFNEFKDFNETGGPVAAKKITNVKISTFDKGLIGGINQFDDIEIPQFNVGLIAQESINGDSRILISNGDVVVGTNVDINKLDVKDKEGVIYKNQEQIDSFLKDARSDLIKLNNDLWNKEITAGTKYDNETITFDLVNGLNVFEVDFSSGRRNINFNYVSDDAKNSTIIIKVRGNIIDYKDTLLNGKTFHGENTDNLANRVIWTFDPSIKGNDIEVKNTIVCGSLLAPSANIAFTSGYCAIDGTIIANGLDASNGSTNSEIHWVGRFMGNFGDEPTEETGSFQFNKKDNHGKVVSGAKFSLYQDEEVKYTVTSSDIGLVSFNDVEEGAYILRETSAPDGYEISNAEVEVRVDKDGNVTVNLNGQDKKLEDLDLLYVNNVIETKADFNFKKVIAGTDTRISGVEFKLMQDNKEVATAVSDKNGSVNFKNIELGTYTLVETKTPVDYEVAGPWTIDVTNKGTFIGGNKLEKIENEKIIEKVGSFQFKKKDNHGKLVSGAEFKLYQDGTEIDTAISTDKGLVSFEGIKEGSYTLRETNAPDGYKISNTEVEVIVNNNGNITFKLNGQDKELVDLDSLYVNNVIETKVWFSFNKVEYGTNETISNVEFKLLQGDKEISTAVSDKNGFIRFENIEIGTYTLVETTPSGYKEAGPWEIEVTKEGAFIGENKLEKIENEKIIEKTGSFQFNKNDNYGNPVNGAEFGLYQDEEVRYTVTSTDAGLVSFSGIKEGTYTLKETSSPKGYEISKAEVEVTVNNDGTVTFKESGAVKTGEDLESLYINKIILGSISFTKYINDKKGILAGAEFKLLINGERYGSTVFSDANGLVTFLNVKPGEYEIREVSSHSNYFKASDNAFTVVIDNNGVSSLVGEDKTEAETLFINKVENSIEFIKYNDSNSVLSNATFELLKGTEIIATSISDKNGVVRFENLLPGEYTVREKSAPKGYIRSETTRKLVVKDNGEISITASEIKEWEEAFKNKAYKSEETPIEDNNNTDNNEDKTTVPQTSDETNVIFPVLAAFLSLAGILLIRKIK